MSAVHLVFIDTQIFLDFYRRSLKEYRGLLEFLPSLKDTLIVTAQLRSEIERNRVARYRGLADQIIPKNLPKMFAIEDFTKSNDPAIAKINERISSFCAEGGELQKQLEAHFLLNIRAISEGSDIVTTALEPLLQSAYSETKEELERARLRKERGQPPGKARDSLGDQINWEQVVSAVSKAKPGCELWLVTRDSDYFDSYGDEFFLAAPLKREVAGARLKAVHLFDDLRKFVAAAQKAGLVTAGKEKVDRVVQAAEAEVKRLLPEPLNWGQFPTPCPNSEDGQHIGTGLFARPSAYYGGWTLHTMCAKCHQTLDTGEPYDD